MAIFFIRIYDRNLSAKKFCFTYIFQNASFSSLLGTYPETAQLEIYLMYSVVSTRVLSRWWLLRFRCCSDTWLPSPFMYNGVATLWKRFHEISHKIFNHWLAHNMFSPIIFMIFSLMFLKGFQMAFVCKIICYIGIFYTFLISIKKHYLVKKGNKKFVKFCW